jgi:hypothetical protein
MQLARPNPECSVRQEGEYIRADVGSGSPDEVQECYRTLAALALEHKFTRVLVVARGDDDAHSLLAARDMVIALHVIGVPGAFKIAFVAADDATRNGFRHAEVEAVNRDLRAKVFDYEHDAVRWLTAADIH